MHSIALLTDLFRCVFSHKEPEAVSLTMENAKKAGVEKFLHIQERAVADFKPIPETITFCNPPYGERMLELQDARKIYQAMGKVLTPPLYIICGDSEFETYFGKKADKRRKLYNGMISCQLYCYFK